MGQTTPKKKSQKEVIQELKEKLDKAVKENEVLSSFAMDSLDETVQFRESDSVLRLQGIKSRSEGFSSVSLWVRALGRRAVGLDSRPE